MRRRIAMLGGTTNLGDCLVALRCLMNPRRLIDGPEIEKYEDAFARLVGVRYACSFSRARVGIYGLLTALGIKPGDEVLLQVPTNMVVPSAIRFTGARPVYVDCTPDTYNMDLEQAPRKITPRSRVLLVQHTFGLPADMDGALYLARRFGLVLIEDCVHALGSKYQFRMIGSFGKAAVFSTGESKTISTTRGGMVVTDDPALATRIREFRLYCHSPSAGATMRYLLKLVAHHLFTEPHIHPFARFFYEKLRSREPLPASAFQPESRSLPPVRYEQRLSNAQAAIGLRQLGRLEINLAHRRRIADFYRSVLSHPAYRPPHHRKEVEPVYLRYPVWVENRNTNSFRVPVRRAILGTWFNSVLENSGSPGSGEYVAGSCPRAEEVVKHLINLPTHCRVKMNDAADIASEVMLMFPLGPEGKGRAKKKPAEEKTIGRKTADVKPADSQN